MFMKKLAVLIILGVLVYGGTSATELTLKDYQAEGLDEKKIVKLVLDYQKAYNRYDPKGVLAVYSPGAIIKAGIKDAGSEHLVTKKEYVGIVADKLATRKMYDLKLIFLAPKKITVQGSTAKLNVPYMLYSSAQYYWEKGMFNFDFRKADSGWLISRNTWKITDLSYNP